MRGYQSIPKTSIDDVEDGSIVLPPTTPPQLPRILEDASSISRPQYPWRMPPLLEKIGYIAIGFLLGSLSSSKHKNYGFDTNFNYLGSTDGSALRNKMENGDEFSFTDHLPFEDIHPREIAVSTKSSSSKPSSWNPVQPKFNESNPSSWNPAQPKFTDHSKIQSWNPVQPPPNEKNSNVNNIPDSSSLTSSIIKPPVSNTAKLTEALSSATPHLLYHAHPSTFSLLYDPSTVSLNHHISPYAQDYFLLNSGGFDAQINQAYCAVATVAALLNSLKYIRDEKDIGDPSKWSFDLPIDSRYNPYPYATQQDILLGECVWNNIIEHGEDSYRRENRALDGIFKPPYGLSLGQASKLVQCHTDQSSNITFASEGDWIVSIQHVDPSALSVSQMREELKAALKNSDARVLINYQRSVLGQVGGGHFSPLGAYNEETDRFLIMDVAKYKYPPVWVRAEDLYYAMATVDKCGFYDYPKAQERLANTYPMSEDEYAEALDTLGCEKRMRGYLIVKRR